MTLRAAELAERFPRLFHMAEAGSWPSIEKHGLLSTSRLLDLFEIRGNERTAIEARHRPHNMCIQHPKYGTAIIRDQKPMSDAALKLCLRDGMSPADWYRLLNRHVFFWLTRARLDRLLSARAYRNARHTIIEIDTKRLLDVHQIHVFLTPINTGSTLFKPQPRGRDTFQPIDKYPFDQWRARRGARDAIAELVVPDAVNDVTKFVLRVTEEGSGAATKILVQ